MSDRPGLDDQSATGRLFFAIWPDDGVRRQLHQAATRLHTLRGGRRTRAGTIHLTLVFLGALARTDFARLIDTAASVEAQAFSLTLDRADCWRHNRVAFLTDRDPPRALFELVERLEGALAAAGFNFDRRRYKPHITLLRHTDCAQENPALEPIAWAAREFVLVESVPGPAGVTYPVVARFPLHRG